LFSEDWVEIRKGEDINEKWELFLSILYYDYDICFPKISKKAFQKVKQPAWLKKKS
jgi:hypothetical protein